MRLRFIRFYLYVTIIYLYSEFKRVSGLDSKVSSFTGVIHRGFTPCALWMTAYFRLKGRDTKIRITGF